MLAYFRQLWDEGFPHPLHIVGGTDIVYHPERLTMGQLVQRDYGAYIRSGKLLLHGKIAPAVLEDKLKSAQVIIVPSIVDNLPYTVIEAMSLGKTVLASVQGGQREMIDDGLNGFLFDHNVPGDFGRRLADILSLTDQQLITIGDAAREKLKSMFDAAKIAEEKLLLLNKIISANKETREFPFLHQEAGTPLEKTNGNGKLSIVVPFYNMGDHIAGCVRSLQTSTYPDKEILIVDDGSTDPQSIAILERLEGEPSVKIYRKKNEGLAETRNFGASRANGEFLAFLDADDRVDPDYYAKAVRVLQQYDNVFFAGSWVSYFGNTRRNWVGYSPQPPYILVHNTLNSSGLIYKKQAFCRAGLNDRLVDYGLEDYESIISLMAAGYNGVALPEFLFHYQVRKNSMFRKLTRGKLLYSYKYIAEKHAAYYAKFAPGVTNLLNANGPGFDYDNPTFEVSVHSRQELSSRWLTGIKALVKKNATLKRIALKFIK